MEKEKGRGKGRVEKVYNRQQKVKEKMSNEVGVVLRGKWEGGEEEFEGKGGRQRRGVF